LGIIYAVKCHYRNQLIQKTAAMTYGGLIQNATQMELDVLSAMHFIAEAKRMITPTTIKNCFVKYCSSNDISSIDGGAVKLRKDEEGDWYSLPLAVQVEVYTTLHSAL
jgi:hypothetical protein